MTVALFPRLDAIAVDQQLVRLDELIAAAKRPMERRRFPADTRFAASGGNEVDIAVLSDIRARVVEAARACGFPDRGSTADRARFDNLATIALADVAALASGEGDRDDVWAFIATIVLPDVSAWRFVGRSANHFHGGIRNTFQRLWMRAWALDGSPAAGTRRWELLENLSEDALVQLTERPSIGSDRALSRAIGSVWIDSAAEYGRAKMEAVMRKAIVGIRIRNEIHLLSSHSDEAMLECVHAIFSTAARELGIEKATWLGRLVGRS